jgi:hypothetical protein
MSTTLRQSQRKRLAQAAPGAGDDRDTSLLVSHRSAPPM